MFAMEFLASQRGRIGTALSLIFIWATAYYLWAGGHKNLDATAQSWRTPLNSIQNSQIVTLDDHFAFHTEAFPHTAPPKIGHSPQEYNNHFASHTKTFSPTAAAAKVQTIPTEDANRPVGSIFIDDFDDNSIREVCANTTWETSRNVVINCQGREGSIADVKQKILFCLRDAIEVGASLMLPTIIVQSEGVSQYQNGSEQPLNYMFDLEIFYARLRKSCPLLPLYPNLRTLEKHGRSIERVDRPKDLPEKDGKRMTIKEWVEEKSAEVDKITMFNYPQVIGQTPVCKDNNSFVTNFGKILEIRPDARWLAESVLFEREGRLGTFTTTSMGVVINPFVGMYLSSEDESVSAGSTNFEKPIATIFDYVTAAPLKVVYVASENDVALELFKEAATKQLPAITVLTKSDLLRGDDVNILMSMTRDQQAMVDYLILGKSTKFAGFAGSSFSWSIAYGRRKLGDLKHCTPNSTEHTTIGNVAHEDSPSTLYGNESEFSGDMMWP